MIAVRVHIYVSERKNIVRVGFEGMRLRARFMATYYAIFAIVVRVTTRSFELKDIVMSHIVLNHTQHLHYNNRMQRCQKI